MRSVIRIILASLLLTSVGCTWQSNFEENSTETLFEKLSAKQTGIHFENTLSETDTFNILFYEFFYNGAGIAIADLNNDGLSDIFFGGNMEKSTLYLNKGNLQFQDITLSSGINTLGHWVTGISMVDINQDGWLDIYICVGGNIADDYRNLLYINDGDSTNISFTEKAALVGLQDDGYSTQAAFLDYDRDGDLDMYLVTSAMNVPNKNRIRKRKNDGSAPNTDRLYRNDGMDPSGKLPRFSNVSNEAGIKWDGFGLGVSITDINLDGWPDIFVANDYISNDLLYINQHDGTFTEEVDSFFRHLSYSTMGVDVADFNNDGLVDLFAVDMLPPDHYRKRMMAGSGRSYSRYQMEKDAGYSDQYIRNTLQMNNGNNSFSEIGQFLGIDQTDWSWAPLFADFNNDGYKDLFVGNGIPHDITNMDFVSYQVQKTRENPTPNSFKSQWKSLMDELRKKGEVKISNYIFENAGGIKFDDRTANWGLTDASYSNSAAFSDLDNDGDLDLVINNLNDLAFVYKNRLINANGPDSVSHYLQVRLLGFSANREGIGSRLKIYYGDQQQYYEHFPVRGFQSMVDPKIHFGLKDFRVIDSLYIWWPDGKEQIMYNLEADELVTIRYTDADIPADEGESTQNNPLYFRDVTENLEINYQHFERGFNDFNIQPLIPHQYSKEGPGIAVADINGDGMEDFFVGGSTSFSGYIFKQDKSGRFIGHPLPGDNNYEDMGALFFDVDADGDQDLFVVSGGTGLPPANPFYRDRLYLNDGQGVFTMYKDALPDIRVCGSQVTACDFDKDGDLDLFVAGRVDLEHYPFPAQSYLLRNESTNSNVRFENVTHSICPDLEHVGLVSAALWSDFDQDGWTDLILCGEWMSMTFYRNDKGVLKNITDSTGIEKYTGLWNSLSAADFDQDGDMDYVAGNLGLNSRFRASRDEPMRIYASDFDQNGSVDPICTYYIKGLSYPIYDRDLLLKQLPYLRKKLTLYEDYAKSQITDIFPLSELNAAYTLDCSTLGSSYIENLGKGRFKLRPLPREAQIAPTFGIITHDLDFDGLPDILLTGNSYSSDVETGRNDASIGLFLKGKGNGSFTPVRATESGFFMEGDCKGMAALINNQGNCIVLAAQNSGALKAHISIQNGRWIRIRDDDATAEVTYSSGKTERKEFYYGSGYLSESSRRCQISSDAISVRVTDYQGHSREILTEGL